MEQSEQQTQHRRRKAQQQVYHIQKELLQTEVRYVQQLKTLVQEYSEPLRHHHSESIATAEGDGADQRQRVSVAGTSRCILCGVLCGSVATLCLWPPSLS